MRTLWSAAVVTVVLAGCGANGSTPSGGANGPTAKASPTVAGASLVTTLVAQPKGNGGYGYKGVAYGNNTWVAVGFESTATSSDGATWQATAVTDPQYSEMKSVTFANGVFVTTSNETVSTSRDGQTWSGQQLANAQGLGSAAFGNGTWVVIDDHFLTEDAIAFMVSSDNGATWTPVVTSLPYASMLGIAYGKGEFVVVGSGGSFAISQDGRSWTEQASDAANQSKIIFANNMFVAFDGYGDMFSSTDAQTWTTAPGRNFSGVAFGEGLFVGVGGAVETSPDAQNWTLQPLPGPQQPNLQEVAFANHQFVTVGDEFAVSKVSS